MTVSPAHGHIACPWPHSFGTRFCDRRACSPQTPAHRRSKPSSPWPLYTQTDARAGKQAPEPTKSYERTHENQRIVRGLRTFSGHLRHLRTSSLIVNVSDVRVATMDLRKPPDISGHFPDIHFFAFRSLARRQANATGRPNPATHTPKGSPRRRENYSAAAGRGTHIRNEHNRPKGSFRTELACSVGSWRPIQIRARKAQ